MATIEAARTPACDIAAASVEPSSIVPIETSLRGIAEIAVSEEDAKKLSMGQGISPKNYGVKASDCAAAYSCGCLIALVRIDERKISPIRVFNLD